MERVTICHKMCPKKMKNFDKRGCSLESELATVENETIVSGYNHGNKKERIKQQQNQRGSKSLTNLKVSDGVPEFEKNRKKKNFNYSSSNNLNKINTFRDGPPSYNESFRHYNQMSYFNQKFQGVNAPPMYLNAQPMPTRFSTHRYSPNSGNQFPSVASYQLLNPHSSRQQQFQQHHQFPQQHQFPPRQPFQRSPYNQQLKQNSSNNTHPQNSRPSNTSQQAKVTTNVNQRAPSQQIGKKSNTRIDLNCLVKELSEFNGFFTSVETLSKILGRNYIDVLEAVKSNSRIFSTITDDSKKVLVELCPKLELCHEHIGLFGCTKQKCFSLHVCADFINDKCEIKNCPFGHIWKTDYNNWIFKEFFLSILPNANLHNLIKKVLGKIIIPEICPDYLKNECKLDDECNKLHICYSYVSSLGNCTNETNCSFNHNIRNSNCLAIFHSIGISTNESPRDLLKILKERCLEGKETKNFGNPGIFKEMKSSSVKPKTNAVNKEEKDKQTQSLTNNTVCCWQCHGNVDIPEICIENINKKCINFLNGCKYLHCNHKSHWQFGSNDIWYNFHLFHSQILTTKYSDINCNKIILPKLNPTKVNNQQTFLFSLMGKENSKIDFVNMKMDCEEVKNIYDIRHLTIKSNTALSDRECIEFKWYFLSNDDKWNLFGNTESSSHIIEKAYQDQPSGKFIFKSSEFTYLLKFSEMTQENLSTQKIRPIKRRPVIKEDINKEEKDKFKIPKHWENMSDNDIYKMVILSSGNEEYVEIRQILRLSLPMINIVNIYRIQNENLWKQFQNKQTELKKKHNDDLNIQKLFHGIDPKFLQEICRDNLEFRLHDDPTEEKPYGDGTYFYNSASVATKKCKIDFMGNKTVLVAEVIIGGIAEGSQGITRPPTNPLSNDDLCNTTTDNIESPTVFVKYNRQEYYPAYIVELK